MVRRETGSLLLLGRRRTQQQQPLQSVGWCGVVYVRGGL
jgi:hypothetical protein